MIQRSAIREVGRDLALRAEAEHAAGGLPPLLVEAERIAQTVAFGVHGRRATGPGDSFWQFRRYEPEDPATSIDWRQSARSQHVFVREREWEAAQSVWFWRDASPSMNWRSAETRPTKRDRAAVLLLAAASLLTRGGERIGPLLQTGRAGGGRAAVRKLAAHFSDNLDAADAPPRTPLPRFSTVVLASDFFVEPDDAARMVAALAASGAKGHLIQIVDPAEEEFPFEGRIRFEDADGFQGAVIGRAQSLRDAYRERFMAHRAALAAIARRYGWTFQHHRTDRSPTPALMTLGQTLGAGRAGGRAAS